ncbi:hypothetical protein RO3G_04884 [Rhizopus delemar RA 99-880]|uniref:Uncharacterized protein n=1 Tax=Rhizopus delemar (strain RA 99-880 / ATCC MYA-4621 / FGSC 9543 / NRRL 43880) TaxID=246409 RepID=I1BVE9_RHIO9|nr:hypothetical protein RO3G_04884 [Rhizopus delemar RA 99-880]|eukprot:EIE80179.1 hypothetical protein RO3G_04884 [Rhizopus delemar RA 99-880]
MTYEPTEDGNSFFNEEDQEEKDTEQYNQKECILFVIDCNPTMFIKDEKGDIPVKSAFEKIRSSMLSKVLNQPTDQVGIVLFGTREKQNATDNESVYVLQTIDIPDASRIKEIDGFIQNISTLHDKYRSIDWEFPMSDLFWVCSDAFFGRFSAPKYSAKRMFLITNNDNPHQNNDAIRQSSVQRAKDLITTGVEIRLFGLQKDNKPFNPSLFYNAILDDPTSDSFSCHPKLEQLEAIVKSKRAKSRSQFHLPLKLSDHLSIGVTGYNMIIEQRISTAKYFYTAEDEVKEAIGTTRWICVDTNQPLTRMDIDYAFNYGGEKIIFSKKELEDIQTLSEPGILLLGFRDIKELEPHYQVTHPYFIYPDDTVNNTKIVKAKDGNLFFYKKGKYTTQDCCSYTSTNQEAIETAKEVVNKLYMREGFDPNRYENPCKYYADNNIRNHNNMIQTIALETEFEPEVDTIIPNYELIENELVSVIDNFKEQVGLDNITEEELLSFAVGQKRKVIDQDLSDSYKKLKLEGQSVENLWEQGQLTKLTNDSLKNFLKENGVQPKKVKADLVAQVSEYLSKKFKTN